MKIHVVLVSITIFLLGHLRLVASPDIGVTVVAPSTIIVNVPTGVKITAAIPDSSLIPNSVTLLRVDSGGQAIATLGTLHDDGLNGDVIAGDKIYTAVVTFTEPAPVQIYLQVSAAFRGMLRRTRTDAPSVFVQTADASDRAVQGLADELAAGDTIAALKRFVPSDKTTGTLSKLDAVSRSRLAAQFRSATLLSTAPDLKIYQTSFTAPNGSTLTVKFTMIANGTGNWVILNW
jgi:hypothetical protein